MNKIGVITELQNNKAIVMIAKAESCGNCGCRALTRKNGEMCKDDKQFITVNNHIDAKVGDPVNVEFNTSKLLSASILLYFVPLVMMVFGIVLATILQGESVNEIISFLAGITSLAVSYIILSFFDKKKEKEELITISEFKGF